MRVEQPVPQDLDAERAVLGAIFLAPEQLPEIQEIVRPVDFGRAAHRSVFEAMLALSARGDAVDVVTVADELRSMALLDEVGGLSVLASLDANVPSTGNTAKYAQIVRDRAQRRRLLAASVAIADLARDVEIQTVDAVGRAEAEVLAVANDGLLKNELETVGRALREEVFPAIEARFGRDTDVTGLATGWTDFDRMTTGLHPGDLVIVAGRPAMGKTSVAMQIAAKVSMKDGPSLVFSLEMPRDQLIERILASESRVDSQRLRTGKLLETDWPKLAPASERIFRSQLIIQDNPNVTIHDVRAIARRTKRKFGGLSLCVVDYLQIMQSHGDGRNREQEISGMSRGLKQLARELACPVIALSQLNRGLEQRQDKRPLLSDLRESGAIEQDADLVMFVYRDEIYNPNTQDKNIAELIIGKQRNGPIGTVKLAFKRELTRFESLAAEDGSQRWG